MSKLVKNFNFFSKNHEIQAKYNDFLIFFFKSTLKLSKNLYFSPWKLKNNTSFKNKFIFKRTRRQVDGFYPPALYGHIPMMYCQIGAIEIIVYGLRTQENKKEYQTFFPSKVCIQKHTQMGVICIETSRKT